LFLLARLTSDHMFAYLSPDTNCFSNVLFLEKLVHVEFLRAIIMEKIFSLACFVTQLNGKIHLHCKIKLPQVPN